MKIKAIHKGIGNNCYAYYNWKVFDMKLTDLWWEARDGDMWNCIEFCRAYSGIEIEVVDEVLTY